MTKSKPPELLPDYMKLQKLVEQVEKLGGSLEGHFYLTDSETEYRMGLSWRCVYRPDGASSNRYTEWFDDPTNAMKSLHTLLAAHATIRGLERDENGGPLAG